MLLRGPVAHASSSTEGLPSTKDGKSLKPRLRGSFRKKVFIHHCHSPIAPTLKRLT